MNAQIEGKKPWLSEVEEFIDYWENATEEIQTRSLDLEECEHISEMFRRDSDELLLLRPTDVSDDQIVTRLEQLDNQLTTSLAMVCKVQASKK